MHRLLYLLLILSACATPPFEADEQATAASRAQLDLTLMDRPNILWIVAEDLSPLLPDFGDSTVETPNLSWLASQGVSYDNVFASTPVCAPARAALATGMYANHIAANHMRTGPWMLADVSPRMIRIAEENMPAGIPPYEALPPPEAKMMSEYLRLAGYYCTNNNKEDYQFRKPVTAWDESSSSAHWRDRPAGMPFFSVFNLMVTHESMVWAKASDSLWVPDDLDVPVPPYLPDTEIGRQDIRRVYSNIKEMDAQVGVILDQLREDGLLDSTIIVWYSDHGGPLPRQKRLLYDSGLRVPMIIRYPGAQAAGKRDDQLISFVDFAPTTLSMVGIEPPGHMDGQAWLGPYAAAPREHVFAAADRFGASTDNNRAARDKRFKYIRYYHPDEPRFLHTAYRDQMPIMQELYRLRDEGKLTDVQAQWFRSSKPAEELFDTQADPHEIRDLAGDPKFADKLQELRTACEEWVERIDDRNLMPETELIATLWPQRKQPATEEPVIEETEGMIQLSSPTPGASIGYKWVEQGAAPGSDHWAVYDRAFPATEGERELVTVAHRIGYTPSDTIRLSFR